MRYLLTSFLFAVLNSNAVCQTTTYNPDANEDNVVGVSDMLALLSLFGETDVDEDGIWDSSDDCLSDTCQFKAYLLIEPIELAGQIGTYMYQNGSSSFFGYSGGGIPTTSDDIFQYMSFYDEFAGTGEIAWADNNGNGVMDSDEFNGITVPALIEVEIPQESGGLDNYNNDITQYLFKTVKLPSGTAGQYHASFLISDESIGGVDSGNRIAQFSFGVASSVCLPVSSDQIAYGQSVFYEGENFAPGTYRIYKLYISLDNSSSNHYFKASGLATE